MASRAWRFGWLLLGPVLMAGGACAALAEPLPFRDGRYLSDPGLCALSEDQLLAEVGDDIYTMLVEISGSSLNEGYGAYCDVRQVWRSGDVVEFLAACDAEGETYDVRFSYVFISPTSFRIEDQVYRRCG